MIRNYFKIAWRNIWKNKLFSMINVISLAIGLSASFVIGIMVYYDYTFDNFHPDGDRIYRVTSKFSNPEDTYFNPGVPIPLVAAVKNEVSGIESTAFFHQFNSVNVKQPQSETVFKQQDFVIFADQNYFDLFHYNWLAGSSQNILSNPNEVILTESRAKLYFPNLSPIQVVGKKLTYNDSIPGVVTGIVADLKERTDFIFQEFLSLKTAPQTDIDYQINGTSWHSTWGTSQFWVKLKEGTFANTFQEQLNKLAIDHEDSESLKYGSKREFYAQPLDDLHFNSDYGTYDPSKIVANKDILTMLSLVALFLLLLGCANFINLNTAQATQRAKEIGIRKTLGSSKSQIIFQFLGETFLLTVVAGIISLILSVWLMRIFSDFIAEGIGIKLLLNPYLLGFIAGLLLLVTVMAGFYPGLVLSKFRPARVLKGQNAASGQKNGLRKFLTIFQFTIAYTFIISTLLIGKQINFLIKKDMGFKTESVAYIETPRYDETGNQRKLLSQKLSTIPQLKNISMGGQPPASFDNSATSFVYKNGAIETQVNVRLLFGDSEYLDIYDIPLLAGRKPLNDTIREAVLNTAAIKKMGFKNPEDAVDQMVSSGGMPYLITGVMPDFNQGSLKGEIQPMAFVGDIWRSLSTGFDVVHFSLPASNSQNLSAILAQVEHKYKEVYPDEDMDLHFMDETILKFYEKESSMTKLLNWATGLSILISCLGLLGLVIYTTDRRVKEIGIRKVLGATMAQLNALLVKDFLILVLMAFIIAVPLAWYGVDKWLQGYAYKTTLSWWIFGLSGFLMLGLAVVIISIKTFSIASKNPVNSLRTE